MKDQAQDTDYRIREVHATLDRRIEGLERRGRHGRFLFATGFLAALGAFGISLFALKEIQRAYLLGDVAPTLETQALVIRDAEGLERVAIRYAEDGSVSLSLKDDDANPRLRLSVLEDGSPGVSLLDSHGDARAILGFLPDGTTTLVFADAGSVARSVLALTPDGASRIVFSDGVGETRAAMGVNGQGRPEVNTMPVNGGGEIP